MPILQSAAQSAITIFIFLVLLGGLVLIHEVGHFVVARMARIRVHEFGIGFPPRARVLGSDHETTYTLNWLPIGGFVKLEGEDGDSEDERSFTRARLPVKLLVLVAGVAMNLLLAFVIFFGIAWLATPLAELTWESVQADSPASNAGLVAGDALYAIDGETFTWFDGPDQVLADLKGHAGQAVTLSIRHADGATQDITVTLRSSAEIGPTKGALGVSDLSFQPSGQYGQTPLPEAFLLGLQQTVSAFLLIIGGLAALVTSVVSSPTTAPPVTGPVGIAVQVGDVFWQQGPIFTLYLAGLLSANLALVNALPFPPLDGGRMVVVTLKSVAGSRISVRAEQLAYMIGFVALFGLLIWVTFFDVVRQIGGGVTP